MSNQEKKELVLNDILIPIAEVLASSNPEDVIITSNDKGFISIGTVQRLDNVVCTVGDLPILTNKISGIGVNVRTFEKFLIDLKETKNSLIDKANYYGRLIKAVPLIKDKLNQAYIDGGAEFMTKIQITPKKEDLTSTGLD